MKNKADNINNSEKKTDQTKVQAPGSEYRETGKPETSSMAVMKKVLKFIGRYRYLLLLSIITASGSVVLQLYIPILFGNSIDCIVGQNNVDFAEIKGYLKIIFILLLIEAFITWLMNIINNRLAFKTVADIRSKAIRHIQKLPLSYIDRNSEGDIVQKVTADADQLSDGLLLGFSQLFSSAVMIIMTIIFMLTRNIPITLMVVVLTPVSFLVAKFIASHTFSMFQEQTKVRGEQTAFINEMISNEKIVKAFDHEKEASAHFSKLNADLKKYSTRAIFFSSLTNPSTRAVNSVIYALVALTGAFSIINGHLTVGGLTVLLTYANQYMKPFNDISSVFTELQNAMACAARVFSLIEAEPQSPEPEEELSDANGRIDIENAAFSYVKDKKLIEDFNLNVRPGQTIAIVGPTGCGKTTFINLLMRFYDVNAGTIKVDGKDIYSVSRHSLRKNYGMVLQDTWLMDGTIRENIAFGKPDAGDDEIIAAAKDAHSWEFIKRMPEKLDTFVTDDSLSQGQKQLLCISRVMLTKPPMLILDEATSSIDTRTEILIQNAFNKLMTGRTSFIVAHRLSTIRHADIILVMKDGRIIEQGSHDELIAKGGFYKTLYNSQFDTAANV